MKFEIVFLLMIYWVAISALKVLTPSGSLVDWLVDMAVLLS